MVETALEVEVIPMGIIKKQEQLEKWVSRNIVGRFTVPKGLLTPTESVHKSMSSTMK